LPLHRKQTNRSLNRRAKKANAPRSKKARRAKRARENLEIVPEQSFKILPPEPGPCRMRRCREKVCFAHCRENPKGHRHELDPQHMGWAKGDGTGRFDVHCRHCGEVGYTILNPAKLDIDWG
jgi:hypothetical protein